MRRRAVPCAETVSCETVSCHDTVSVLHTDTRESQQYLTHMGISLILSPYDDVSNGLCGQCTVMQQLVTCM